MKQQKKKLIRGEGALIRELTRNVNGVKRYARRLELLKPQIRERFTGNTSDRFMDARVNAYLKLSDAHALIYKIIMTL